MKVEVLFRDEGNPAKKGATPNGRSGPKNIPINTPPKDPPLLSKIFGGMKKFTKGTLGLNFGVSSLLKQSQIFTSTIGVIFQLLGALVDVMLAPLLPLIIPLIRWMGKQVPVVAAWAQKILPPMVNAIMGWIKGFVSMWNKGWSGVKEAFGNLVTNFSNWWSSAGPWIQEKLVALVDWATSTAFPWLWDKGTTLIGNIISFVTDTWIPWLAKTIEELPEKIQNWWSNTVSPWIKNEGLALIASFGTWINEKVFPFVTDVALPKLWSWFTGTFIPASVTAIVWYVKTVFAYFKLIWNILSDLGGIIGRQISNFIEWIWGNIKGLFGKLLSWAGDKLGSLPFGIGKAFKGLGSGDLIGDLAPAPRIGASAMLGAAMPGLALSTMPTSANEATTNTNVYITMPEDAMAREVRIMKQKAGTDQDLEVALEEI